MPIRLPGLPPGVEAQRICNGSMVGDDEFELRGKTVRKGGHFQASALIVTPKAGWEFVPSPKHGDGYFVAMEKKS